MLARRIQRTLSHQWAALRQVTWSGSVGKAVSCNVSHLGPSIKEAAKYSWEARTYFNDPRGAYVHFKPQKDPGTGTGRLVVLAVGAGGCTIFYVSHREEVPYTHRKHAVFVSPETEKMLGLQTFTQVKAEAAAAGKLLPPQHPATVSVRRIGERIAAQAANPAGGGRTDHMKSLQWEFVVINEPDNVNAFVMPGGKVVVYTGLLRLLRKEDEIAAVLGHEVAHVLGRHIGEKLSSAALFTLLQIALALTLGFNIPSDLFQLAVFLPNSRKQESEADVIGIHLSARACFDPTAAVDVFTKLGEAERSQGIQTPTFLRTHPLSEKRVKAIEKNLPKALEDYEMAGCNAPREFFPW
ncbi:g2204 [Coccomyxa elongata]